MTHTPPLVPAIWRLLSQLDPPVEADGLQRVSTVKNKPFRTSLFRAHDARGETTAWAKHYSQARAAGRLEAEATGLRLVARLGLLAPRLLGRSKDPRLLAMSDLPGRPLIGALAEAGPLRRAGLLTASARWLAVFHAGNAPECTAFDAGPDLARFQATSAGAEITHPWLQQDLLSRIAGLRKALGTRHLWQSGQHWDASPSNILVSESGEVGFLDFEYARRGLRTHDLAMLLVRLQIHCPGPGMEADLDALTRGYGTAEVDAEALQAALVIVLAGIGRSYRGAVEDMPEPRRRGARRYADAARWTLERA